ncbi:MAG: T9SS type A sorting domain-containing protein, partial [Rhodothermales bacterium]|nr:T9SS type A sorting domain-containing protein [Rhodothermales bacterium]
RLVFVPEAPLTAFTTYGVSIGGITSEQVNPVTQEKVSADLSDLPQSWLFTTSAEPFSITVLSPNTAVAGALITAEGSGFATDPDANSIFFPTSTGGTSSAKIVRSTVTSVTAEVPLDAVTGTVTVVGASGQGEVSFTLYVEPEEFDTAVRVAASESAPSDVEVSPDGTFAVVPNAESNTLSIIKIDPDSDGVASIPVGETPLSAVITPDGTRAYVTNFNSNTVSVVDLTCALESGGTGCVRDIPVGFNPVGIDVAPDGSRVYVGNYSSRSISVIDAIPSSGTFNRAVRTLGTERLIVEAALDPDGALRHLLSEDVDSVTELDPDGALRNLLSEDAESVADLDPDGALRLLLSEDAETVAYLDPDGAIRDLLADSSPTDVEASPDGAGVFVGTNYGALAIEVSPDKPQAEWGVTILVSESHESSSSIDPDGGVVILASESAGSSTELGPDGAGTILVSDSTVRDVEMSPDGGVVYFVMGTGELQIYGLPEDPYSSPQYEALTKLGAESQVSSVETSPDGTLVYVTSFATSSVSVYEFGPGLGSAASDPLQVSGTSYGIVLREVIQLDSRPDAIAYDPVNDIAIVSNPAETGAQGVSIIEFRPLALVDIDDIDGGGDADGDGVLDSRQFLLAQLEEVYPQATDKDAEDYEKAVEHATENVDDGKLWNEDATPSSKHGKKVFSNDKQIVKALGRVVEREGLEAALAGKLINLTIRLDRDIATSTIDLAQEDLDTLVDGLSLPCDKKDKQCRNDEKSLEEAQKELDKAREELAKAEGKVAEGDLDKAVDHFRKAWDKAEKSMDEAAGKGLLLAEDLPIEFDLSPNYPNPFNPATTIEFAIPEAIDVRLEVFDVLGRRVQTLVNGQMDAGYHSVQFNAERLASGLYLYRIEAGTFSKVHTMVLMK